MGETVDRGEFEVQNLTKSCNETLILAALEDERKHGYQLALEIEERSGGWFRFNHGTLYPILHKLEKEGLIHGRWRKEGLRRKRKIYAISARGRKRLDESRSAWGDFFRRFFEITGGNER